MSARIIDACCLINLYASRKPVEIVRAFGGEFFVPDRVSNEALTIRKPDEDKPAEDNAAKYLAEPIDLTEASDAGVIQGCRIEGQTENEHFVRYAMQLDDGEAACLAIAKRRGGRIVTDDKKAIRLATAEQIGVVTTGELVHHWAEVAKPKDDEVAEALRNIELFAHFRLGKSAKYYPWWTRMIGR